MSANALLAALEAAGVRLSLAGTDLRAQARPDVRIALYRERITAHKPALLVLLRSRQPVAATKPPAGWDAALCAGCQWPDLSMVRLVDLAVLIGETQTP